MFVPFISVPSHERLKKLYRRKGGGGRGGGGGKSGGSNGSGSGTSGGGRGAGRSAPISSGGSTKSATPFGPGGGRSSIIPAGQPFAGRASGGGSRNQVYGNSQYGSGYPGVAGRGVTGRGFPFIFWPLAFGGIGGLGAGAYLHNSEYGRPNNSSRPGGPLATAIFFSNSANTTYRLLADNTTVASLITDIKESCSSNLNGSTSSAPSPYEDSLSALPQPEQTVQYYRASSVALSLDGYNNTAVFAVEGTPDVPLPDNIDKALLSCLNQTIGEAVPLVGGVPGLSAPNLSILGVFWIVWTLSSMF
ncbi:hypothetical protein D9615_006913 [Tricholomella constricta]|uniref:Uncharacterized protein n=1 Tax=Tricholomella constricta TaxID=117010 RepID=A0A8H5H985_9AGAR|nr:hypothetical protein D9615_006913 [Tricholomella constricta]